MRKLIIISALILVQFSAISQISVDAGLTSYLGATMKVGYEVTTKSSLNIETNTRLALVGTPQLSQGLLIGKQIETKRGYFKMFFGGYYNILKPSEEDKLQGAKYKPFTFGAGLRWEVNRGIWGFEYTGKYACLTVGLIFKKSQ